MRRNQGSAIAIPLSVGVILCFFYLTTSNVDGGKVRFVFETPWFKLGAEVDKQQSVQKSFPQESKSNVIR